jgi:hypothetical protein
MRTFLFALTAILVMTLAFPASAQLDRMTGNWVNMDSNTGGLVRLEVLGTETNLRVHAWGACTPTPCDWGEVGAFAYGPNVSANLTSSARVISAQFVTSFSETLLLLRPTGADQIQVETMTRFTDGSGRTGYTSVETFQREVAAPQSVRLNFNDAYLVYEPGSGTLQIAAQSNVLSYGSDWEVRQLQPYLYHMRQAVWHDFYWKINTSRGEAYRVRMGTFGALGGTEEMLNMRVEPVGNPDSPERFFLRFMDAYLIYQPPSTLQIAAQGNVLSYGSDWYVQQAAPQTVHLREQVWRDFFWKVDTATAQVFRVRGGTFGVGGGLEEPLAIECVPTT